MHEYKGDVVTLKIGNEKIDCTGNHPFWVVKGDELAARPAVMALATNERGMTVNGRWMEARCLRPRDSLLLRDGRKGHSLFQKGWHLYCP